MKKNYIYCFLSIIVLIAGFICTFLYLLPISDIPHIKELFLLFAICFILIGLSAFAVYYKKYTIIKSLNKNVTSFLAHWTFMPHTSTSLTNTIKQFKHNAICTFILIYLLILTFTCTFIQAYYPTYFMTSIIISICFLSIGFIGINVYFNAFSEAPIHIIFDKDVIYFLDDIYTFEKSIYQLDNVTINKTGEPTLLFIYGQLEFEDAPYYILEIPIPESELPKAEDLRRYYLNQIKLLHQH